MDSNHDLEFKGFIELSKELESMISKVENIQDVLEVGAIEFVNDLKKLAKPISKIRKSGYTHLIDTFSYRKAKNDEVEVGWGKYYGRMVELGTENMGSRAHLKPTFEQNKEKYYRKMLYKIWQ
jgi:HK97 gp10 family phage protein